ncbi:MAG: hypothetical protein CL674_10405 [Bdellovibrionaceae bacterium]|nr:hypothetical protein [Pseudobdellovibrionaceae bacterium]|tara:strand:- start:18646 stop:19920 length:1275 start_codon:yes stop_codon:yes gene_type:complete
MMNKMIFKRIFIAFNLLLILVSSQVCFAGAKDGGGGSFTKSKFWYIVESKIIPELKAYKSKENKILSTEQIDKILEKMDEDLVSVEILDKDLFTYENGFKELVDAKNYPTSNKIELNQDAWNSILDSGFSFHYLILHEFMGLAKIADKNARISRKILPPEKMEVAFEANNFQCGASIKYVHLIRQRNASSYSDWFVRDAPIHREYFNLPAPESLNPNPPCAIKAEDTGKCYRYIQDYKIKSLKSKLPVKWYIQSSESDKDKLQTFEYEIEFELSLFNAYYSYGSGGASRNLFRRPSMAELQWKLYELRQNAERTLIHSSVDTKIKLDDHSSSVSFILSVPMSNLEDLMNKNSYSLNYAAYAGELFSKYNSNNIVGSFYSIAGQELGLSDSAERDRFIVNEILKDAESPVLPFRISAFCELQAPN